MTTKVAINGFGRIGRLILRAIVENNINDIEVVAINDRGTPEALAHLFEYDSVHGRLDADIKLIDGRLIVGAQEIELLSRTFLDELDWVENKIDVVLECTGVFASRELSKKHLSAGSKKVLVSAPCAGADFTVVYGVNNKSLRDDHLIVSNGSCTTNCLAPVAYVLQKEVGIKSGFMTTVHSYTGDQPTLDSLRRDMYRSRAAAVSMVPTSTGAAKAIGLVLPELEGKLNGAAIRVPTSNVSVVDLTVNVEKDVTIEELNSMFINYANGELKDILGVSDKPLVSSDFNHDARSSIVALGQTCVVDGNTVRILSWYDNEWAFANRMIDTARLMASL